MIKKKLNFFILTGAVTVCSLGRAAGIPTLEAVEVTASTADLVGVADSASEGTVTAQQLANRPLLRPAEVLEVVPGLVVSQHAGDGKANQYYLRGFNLDHGTDFSASLMGMPVNLPTHAHGQGYLDLNFLIPELVDRMTYRKGPYWAEEGDFSSAGAVSIDYRRNLAQPFLQADLGQGDYRRLLLAGSPEVGDGRLLYGLEVFGNNGPWQLPEGLQRLNGVLRYGWGSAEEGGSLALMAYDSRWRSTDQVPQRAIDGGLIDRYGYVDPTDGGQTHRYSLSGEWTGRDQNSRWKANAYAIDYSLDLWSNFTYASDAIHGDQFQQTDQRRIYGGGASRSWVADWHGRLVENTLGVQARLDRIGKVGLYLTTDRQPWATVREDKVDEDTYAVYAQNLVQWNDWFRSQIGVRGDFQRYRVASDGYANSTANSGNAGAHLWSPKLALVFGPWPRTEFYFNSGLGFHSNDARGALTRINPDPRDPAFGTAVAPVTPMVRSRGTELGLRSAPLAGLQLSAALWRLDIASELLFTGDAGTTEPSRPSRRNGVELSAYWKPGEHWTLDGDLALSRARYTEDDPVGNFIPGAVERVFSLGMSYADAGPWSWGLRLRHFGARPLIEDNSVRSKPSTLVNVQGGYALGKDVKLTLSILNLFDRQVSDIDYYYESQLRGEAAPVADVHTHPAEPRTLRLSLQVRY
ncbi:MAG: TonB-dependent receptor [Rhodocyclaceae bacterium]|nr:MAG: TonB-dependent receptor [Rhodocyclaceae bacterium]